MTYTWQLPLEIALASLTAILCVYVLLSYFRNKNHRKAPAGLMVSKTTSDLLFAIIFFIMLSLPQSTVIRYDGSNNEMNPAEQCQVLGSVFIVVFITSQLYFIAICYDLWRTLRNPFRKPAADSFKIHILVWLWAIIMVGATSFFDIIKYRRTFGICYTCNTGARFNWYNLMLIYLPLIGSNIGGISITIYAVRRLSDGLEKTFELRKFRYCICFIYTQIRRFIV